MSYYFNKKIFRIALVLTIAYLSLMVLLGGGVYSGVSFVCNNDNSYCVNPFYNDCASHPGICLDEYLPPGFTYGAPPSKWYDYADTFFFGVVVLAFLINHLLYGVKVVR